MYSSEVTEVIVHCPCCGEFLKDLTCWICLRTFEQRETVLIEQVFDPDFYESEACK